MRFNEDNDEEDQEGIKVRNKLEMDSPKGSISSKSSFIMFDDKNLIDDNEGEDEFEDAVSVSVSAENADIDNDSKQIEVTRKGSK